MNTKKIAAIVAIMSTLCVGGVFARECPPKKTALDLTAQQWEQLKTLKPEQQCTAFCEGVKANLLKDKMAKLTPAQKAEVEKFIQDDRNHRQAMKERMDRMTPEQKEVIKMQMPKPHFMPKKKGDCTMPFAPNCDRPMRHHRGPQPEK